MIKQVRGASPLISKDILDPDSFNNTLIQKNFYLWILGILNHDLYEAIFDENCTCSSEGGL
jgi:hypothetical protein